MATPKPAKGSGSSSTRSGGGSGEGPGRGSGRVLFSIEQWKKLEGQTLDGLFPLRRYTGGSSASAVFLTEYGGGKSNPERAAIKIVPASDPAANDQRLAAWQTASMLGHENLIRIFAAGECQVEGENFLYVVMEYADEDLSQVIPERPLTVQETREMLGPLLSALAYLHQQGFVHGHLKPSNILASEDKLKISSDSFSAAGNLSPANDVAGVGLLLTEVLTQGAPGARPLPEPFREIAEGCLAPDPLQRWTISDIAARLRGQSPNRAGQRLVQTAPERGSEIGLEEERSRSGPWIAIAVVAVLGLAAWVIWYGRSSKGSAPPTSTPAPVANSIAPAPAANPAAQAPPSQPKTAASFVRRPANDLVARQVLPEIPKNARDTIKGKVPVNVRVRVSAAGDVLDASTEGPKSSKYLSGLTVKAARQWKFASSDAPQEFLLRFILRKDETTVSVSKLSKPGN